MRTVYGDHQRFIDTYFSQYEGKYFTGDGCRRDKDGYYWITGRVDDVIIVSGHNLGTAEVEGAIGGHPAVAEAAVVGIPSDLGDEDVLVAVVPKRGETIDAKALIEFLIPLMPHYMVPRFVRVLKELPKTPTNKLMKFAIRDQGVTADTWDAEAVGIRLKKTRLS